LSLFDFNTLISALPTRKMWWTSGWFNADIDIIAANGM